MMINDTDLKDRTASTTTTGVTTDTRTAMTKNTTAVSGGKSIAMNGASAIYCEKSGGWSDPCTIITPEDMNIEESSGNCIT